MKPESSHAATRGPRIGAVVLAAGASTRMGSPKQLLALEGKPLLVHIVDAVLASPARPCVVVLGAHAEKICPVLTDHHAVHVVENPAWPEGMASSLRTGLAALRALDGDLEGALFVVSDQPAFSTDAVAALARGFLTPGKTIAAATYAGQLGVPALFGRVHFDELAALRGAEGARTLLVRHAAAVEAVPLPDLALDLDTPEDYQAWLARRT